jgi:predicted nucleic acid-binding protein
VIVVDSSVVADALGAATERGEAASSRLSLDPDLHAPHLIDVEVVSALRRFVAAGLLDEEGAILALQDLEALALARYQHSALIPRMWELHGNVTPYDAAYVALAEELGCTLVTSDARLSRVRSLRCPVEVIS